MRIMAKFLLFSLVLLISIGTIAATDNTTEISINDNVDISNDITDNNLETSLQQENYQSKNIEKAFEKNKNILSENKSTKSATTVTVTENNYEQFFTQEPEDKYVKTTDLVKDGDTLNLKGSFYNKSFMVDKSITFTSLNNDAKLYNSTVYVIGQNASGSTISNLMIYNDGTLLKGIQVKNSSNLTIKNNNVTTYGLRAYGFVADYMDNSTIEFNDFERKGDDWRYITFVIGVSHNNTIRNNSIKCGGANGIYLSIYGSYDADFVGGASNYNVITGNIVHAEGYITSWCYTIQIMGAYNTITHNKVIGGFRGISTQDYENNYIAYNEVHAINEGIYACENATVINNIVEVNESATGIKIGSDNVLVVNNSITAENGYGIDIQGNNARITNNNITSVGSNGIYLKGQYNGIIIDDNKIISNKDGILFKQQTRTKKTNNVYVDKNTIISDADYAINFEEAGAYNAIDVNVTVTSSNVLSSAKGRGSIAYLPPLNSNTSVQLDSDQQISINPQNYTSWFTDGIAKTNIEQNATVNLTGTFNNCNFIFNKKVHIIGQNCTINNGTITFAEDAHASTVTNVKICNKEHSVTVHAIELLEVNNCEITNVEIDNFADYESIGIFLYGASGTTVTNNKINTSGDYVNDAILSYSSDSNNITNNTINLNQSNVRLEYDDSIMFNDKIGTITEVLHNHGIMLLYSSNNEINNNKVRVTSQFDEYTFPTNDCKNSVVGIDVYFDSNRNKINNNYINITSYGPFIYGIGVLGGKWGSSILTANATNNEYSNNIVNLNGGYYATGFIAGRNSVGTLVDSNIFNVQVSKDNQTSGDYGHAVVLENSTSSNIFNNTINCKASSLYNIELYDSSNNNIINNTINGNGTNPYGIAGYRSSNNTIASNKLTLRKENLGESTSAYHSDTIAVGDEAIMFSSSSINNNITKNSIITNANTTVKLTEETRNNKVMENSLISNNKLADQSVIDLGADNIVSNNFVYFVNATVNPVEAFVGDTITLVANINTTTTDYRNLSVAFKLGSNNIGNSPVVNGKATLDYNVSTLWNPTTYQITAFVSGNNFQNVTAVSQAVFEKHPEKTNVKVAKVLGVVGSNVVLTANITTTSGGKIGSGQAEFYVDNVLVDVADLRLGVASCNYTIAANANNTVHNIKVEYLGTKDYESANGTNILGVQTLSEVSVVNHTATLGKNVSIKADVVSGGKPVDTGIVKIYVNNVLLTNANVTNGVVNAMVKVPTTYDKGTYDLKVVFDGNDTISNATSKASITLKPMVAVIHYNNTWVDIGANASLNIVIDNNATGNDLCLANGGNVSVKLNGQYLKDSSGKIIYGVVNNGKLSFKFTAPSQLQGTQNLTFVFGGNSKFSQRTQTFNNSLSIGKINVTITVNDIGNVELNENITITGKFTDSTGKPISNSNVKIILNGVKNYAKTDKNGTYTFVTTVTTPGVNTLSVGYSGNEKYYAYERNITFNAGKLDVIVTYDTIPVVPAGTNVTITGKFTESTGKIITNSNVRLFVNGVKYYAKTNSSGKYALSVLVTKVGINNLTVGYSGNAKYNSYEANTIFNVGKQDVIVSYDTVEVVPAGTNVTITGKFTDNLGKAIANSNVKLFVNGVKYYAKTDKNGFYTASILVTKVGVNNLSVGYSGNAKYNSYEVNSTFTVGKQNVIVTYNKITDVKKGNNVTITGKFTDNLGKAITNSNVKLTINGVKYYAKTDSTGKYTFTQQLNKTGTYNVTIGYSGNTKYNPYETNTTFKVTT
ncbi:MAG: right-handed parallel beta-helix repeat-containing protein [Methanosphaera sp.]|nr:right-handed parallel beta-helix repeat-containing protein [Methanosphaera sp.]